MGLRYRKRIKILPGVHLNISNRGVSASFGGPGATVNVSKRGTRVTTGIPGTGLSYSSYVSRGRNRRRLPRARRAASEIELAQERATVMQRLELTNREMRILEKAARKNPMKFAGMTDEQIVAWVRSEIKWRKIGIGIIVFIIILGALTSKS